MKTVCIVQARMTSTRLPGKVLLPLGGKTVLACVIDRLKHAELLDQIVVATTTDPEDDAIVDECEQRGYEWFRGDRDDVLDRYYQCAKEYHADVIVRVTSDCPLIDPKLVDELIEEYFHSNDDYRMLDHDSYSRGLDCEVFRFDALEGAHQKSCLEDEREHVTTYIKRHPELFSVSIKVCTVGTDKYRYTLDYPEDYEAIKIIYSHFEDSLVYYKEVESFLKINPKVSSKNSNVKHRDVTINHLATNEIKINEDYKLIKSESCGFWFVDPYPEDHFLSDFYESNYDDPLEKINVQDKIESLEQLCVGRRLLDIGCGNGQMLEQFHRCGWNVLGIEPGFKDSKQLRGFEIIPQSVENVSSEETGVFDAVLLSFVLEHVPDPLKFIRIVREKFVAKDGIVMIEVPNDFNPLQMTYSDLENQNHYWIAFPDHLNYFTTQSLRLVLEEAGFSVEEIEGSFPMELFLLMGEDYRKDQSLGKICHNKRCQFENALIKTGKNQLKRDLYRLLATIGIGRSINVYARKN